MRSVEAMIRPRDRFIRINGLRLHYLEYGETARPPVLLLHGGSAHAHWWDWFAARLVDRYRVLALDLRGHGDSDWAEAGEYGLEYHAADVRRLAEALELRQLTVAGHSFGGLVAVAAASALRERLAALIVVDTRIKVTEQAARFMGALRRLPHPVYASLEEAIRRFRLLPAANGASAEVLSHMARHAVRQEADGRWTLKFDRRAMVNTRPCDLTAALSAVWCPALFVRGSESQLVSAAALAELAAVTPHGETAEIAGAHHHVMIDQPLALAETVRRFLRRGGIEP